MESDKEREKKWDDLGICDGNGSNVCGDCIGDQALDEFISAKATETACTYCKEDRGSPFALPLSIVVEHMAGFINEEYEHGDFRPGYPGYEILYRVRFRPKNDNVLTDVARYFNKQRWRWRHCTTSADRRESGWNRFCERVMHSRRYTFWSDIQDIVPECHPFYMPPSKMLEEIKDVIAELGLIYELPTETKFWRARNHKLCHPLKPPEDFTSPPLDKAIKPNRMSPAGISMFYGADDADTAAREINPNGIPSGQRASGVCFKSLRPLQILDLMKIVPEKSYFAQEAREWRHGVEFLRRFSRNVSAPIVGPAGASEFVQRTREEPRPDIDYVPTQVFTEYVRYHMTHDGKPDGKHIDGIRYRSSLNHHDHKVGHGCYVLFFDQEDCLKSRTNRKQSLECVEGSIKTVPLDAAL